MNLARTLNLQKDVLLPAMLRFFIRGQAAVFLTAASVAQTGPLRLAILAVCSASVCQHIL